MAMAEERAPGGAGRGPADVATLLIELGRALKACRFYPPEHPARKATLDRGFRAWQSELARAGALDLELRQRAFRVAGTSDPIGRGALDDLARELVHRAVRRIRFAPGMSADEFAALVAALALDPDELAAAGGIERAFYQSCRGGVVTLNEMDYRGALEHAGSGEPASDAPGGEAPGADEGAPGGEPETTGADPLATLAAMLQAPPDEAGDGALRPEPEADRGAELVCLLRRLDECRDDQRYAVLLQEVAAAAASLADERPCDDAYRAILVLSAHATETARSERQRALAEDVLFQLASGARLDDVVSRACATGPQGSVRATQILLQLGAHAVPRLLDTLLLEGQPERRGQLNAILLAMGEKATPEVKSALQGGDPERARLAARLAGEMQNPAVVPYLRNLLREAGTPLDLAREAAKALVRIGSPGALQTLVEVLASPRPELAAAAAVCVGASGAPRALEPLVEALRRSLREGEFELARETIRALGRLGRHEALPVLEDILTRRSLRGRKRLRELKMAAAAAVGRLPGQEARVCLERLADRGDAQLRRAAQTALERRAEA